MTRRSQRRRKRRQRRGRTLGQLDLMHQALGEFLTEMGRVEFRMLLYMDILNEAPLEHLFADYDGESFGSKRKLFIKWCEFGGVPDEQKSGLKLVYKDLADLLEKRNFIVHGETWEGVIQGRPSQPYRVGLVEDNLEYLEDFERGLHGPNVFDVRQIREATALCVNLSSTLSAMRDRITEAAGEIS